MSPEAFAPFVATLGRDPGRSRALTREEARDAFRMVLAGQVDPHQLGAFLMLLRYRGEDPDEVAGIVEAMQESLPEAPRADLDWPSYGSGRTRTLPWFLLSALALAQSGVRVLMHGTNELGSAMPVAEALASLGLSPARDMGEAAEQLEQTGFAYLPIAALAPGVAGLLGLRRLFGLRSPVNTAARLLDPARAPAGVDGVFHPAYLDVHLGVAERLGRCRLAVLKGGGGEAERVPAKPGLVCLWDHRAGRAEIALPADPDAVAPAAEVTPGLLAAVWHGEIAPPREIATIRATIALGLTALRRRDEPEAVAADAPRIWRERCSLAAS